MIRGILFAVVVVVSSYPQAYGQSPNLTALCEIAKTPRAFDGKQVTVEAEFRTDHIERSLLVADTGDCGLLPYVRDGAIGGEAFDDASLLRTPQHLESRISARFTGIVHFALKPGMCMLLDKRICQRSFEITRIDDLKVVMVPIHVSNREGH